MARAKWMLHCTLGCPNTFEYRRQELAALQGPGGGSGPGGGAVSDEVVYADNLVIGTSGPQPDLEERVEYAAIATDGV